MYIYSTVIDYLHTTLSNKVLRSLLYTTLYIPETLATDMPLSTEAIIGIVSLITAVLTTVGGLVWRCWRGRTATESIRVRTLASTDHPRVAISIDLNTVLGGTRRSCDMMDTEQPSMEAHNMMFVENSLRNESVREDEAYEVGDQYQGV